MDKKTTKQQLKEVEVLMKKAHKILKSVIGDPLEETVEWYCFYEIYDGLEFWISDYKDSLSLFKLKQKRKHKLIK